MSLRSTLWRAAAALFVVFNVGGAGFAIAMGEPMHAFVHAVLMTLGLGAYLTWRVARPAPATAATAAPQLPDQRLDYLQQSVDAMALEIERIGEAQRFNEKLRAEKGEVPKPKKEE
jgi:hypothetical protein